ncbi:MAG: cytochrome C oxidase subunit IV family protein [Gemmatimonadota bacterium]
MSETQAHGHSEPHTSNKTYVLVAAVLAMVTAVEVMVFYIEALRPVIVPILVVLSAAKFTLVVSFFMHLKYDGRLLRGLFAGPLLVAVAIILAMMALYGMFTAGAA